MGSLSGSLESYQRHDAEKCHSMRYNIDRDATQLMYLPERFFPELKIEPPIVEALLVPLFTSKISQWAQSGL